MRQRIAFRMTGCLLAVSLVPAHALAQTPTPPAAFVATNTPLVFLLMRAFEVRPENILNAPGWIHTERFDVEAKVAEQDLDRFRDRTTSRAMLRALLAERFKLSVRE